MAQARPPIYGLLAEFETPAVLVEAARQARDAGYTHMDGYSPFPIEELPEALGLRPTGMAALVLLGGLLGCAGGFLMQVYSAQYSYPINVGGRPDFSWPAFIPVTFELTILTAALFAFLGMLALNGLPEPYHPVFNVPRFALATRDRFFLCIEATDPKFDRSGTADFLRSLGSREVSEVEH
jgi:hypothetical protein